MTTPEKTTPLSPIAQKVILILSDHYGIDPEELSLTSDLVEDIDVRSDLEALARFVQTVNTSLDIRLSLSEIAAGLEEGELTIVQDLVNMVEDALLE